MTEAFTKLFNSIITSSIWSEDDKTRLMWITFLASSDANGFVTGSIPGMAAMARMSLKDAEKSIIALTKPDPYSRSKEYEGRRLLVTEGGWLIANYTKYRQKRDPEIRRRQNREAKRRQRSQQNVSQCQPMSAQAEAEADKEEEKEEEKPVCIDKTKADNKSLSRKSTEDTTNSPKADSFDRFWSAYPRKVGKQEAVKAWRRLSPGPDLVGEILTALEKHKLQPQWCKDNGQFILYPASWLNQRRWEDKIKPTGYVSPPVERDADGMTAIERYRFEEEKRRKHG